MGPSDWHEQARSLIARAVLAPSSHNTQPWFFRVRASAVELWADRTRALPVNDPQDRELAISCGCALMNLRIAAASGGLGVQVRLLPEPQEPDLKAQVSLAEQASPAAEQASPAAEDAELAPFIETRRTYRKRFVSREVGAAARDQLRDAAQREGACLVPLLTGEARHHLADLVAEGDAVQWANPSWRRELAAWMHPRRRGDGLIMPTLALPVAQIVVRTFDMGGGIGAKDRQLADASPLLAILGTERDQPRDWLLAGQALQRVLLTGCQHGLQASYLNQPIQVASLRSKLQNLVGAQIPQIVLRLGYPGEAIVPAPRRALEDVIEE